jgi:hypothetical protein
VRIYGIDFTSAPCARKPITVAVGEAQGRRLRISKIESLRDFAAFEALLERPGPWVGGFDFPFGLARQAVTDLAWPTRWSDLLLHCRNLGRAEFKRVLDAYRESRPKGDRYAKRLGDTASRAHPSVKLVNPPVGFMFLEGATRLAASWLHVPGLRATGDSRIALEAYPGLLVRQLGVKGSYKSDTPGKWTPARRNARHRILAALQAGEPLGVRMQVDSALAAAILRDGSADLLDATICAVQAHWAWLRRDANYGLPADLDPLEGWIISS